MDWITGIQNAINYIEDHITEDLDYEQIARQSFSSSFHFQRVFSVLCGYTLGEYIRNRRLSLAGVELTNTQEKIIDIAFKYGYDNPESFANAFRRFHGIAPSQARSGSANLKSFSRLSIKVSLEGGSIMNYKIEEKSAMILTGFKKRFVGNPADMKHQDHEFAVNTRLKQYILEGLAHDCDNSYTVITNFGPDGYDYYIAAKVCESSRRDMVEELGEEVAAWYEHIPVPAGLYLVCETERCQYPVDEMDALRKQAVSEWLPASGYELRNAPEIGVIHWYWEEGNDKLNSSRYCELWLPIAKK